jgi:hypothetical protein
MTTTTTATAPDNMTTDVCASDDEVDEARMTLLDLPGWVSKTSQGESDELATQVQSLLAEYLDEEEEDEDTTSLGIASRSSISNSKSAVLLVATPANVEFHNCPVLSRALKLERFSDPLLSEESSLSLNVPTKGTRTTRRRVVVLPVITKSDLIDPGAESEVLDLLLGNRIRTMAGFHVVKNRGQAALDGLISIQQGLEGESTFFESV